jgi:integral membrane protein (TIGR01906 family)
MEKERFGIYITILIILLAISTASMIYLSNINAVAFDQELYEKEYVKYNIRERFDPSVNLTNETAFLLSYLESGSGEIQTEFFNQREKTHLVEVRDLFKLVSMIIDIMVVISIISFVLLVYLIRHTHIHLTDKEAREYYKKALSGFLIWTGGIVDGIAALFAVMATMFSGFFIKFHLLFFKTDTWMLNPATDNLIRMYPEAFFFDLFVRIVLMSVVFATAMLVAGFVIRLGKPKIFR